MNLTASAHEPTTPPSDAHFTYQMNPRKIVIRDPGTGTKSVKDDFAAVLRKLDSRSVWRMREFRVIFTDAIKEFGTEIEAKSLEEATELARRARPKLKTETGICRLVRVVALQVEADQ